MQQQDKAAGGRGPGQDRPPDDGLVQDEPVFVPAKPQKPRPGAIWLAAQEFKNPKGNGVLNFGPGPTIGVGA